MAAKRSKAWIVVPVVLIIVGLIFYSSYKRYLNIDEAIEVNTENFEQMGNSHSAVY